MSIRSISFADFVRASESSKSPKTLRRVTLAHPQRPRSAPSSPAPVPAAIAADTDAATTDSTPDTAPPANKYGDIARAPPPTRRLSSFTRRVSGIHVSSLFASTKSREISDSDNGEKHHSDLTLAGPLPPITDRIDALAATVMTLAAHVDALRTDAAHWQAAAERYQADAAAATTAAEQWKTKAEAAKTEGNTNKVQAARMGQQVMQMNAKEMRREMREREARDALEIAAQEVDNALQALNEA